MNRLTADEKLARSIADSLELTCLMTWGDPKRQECISCCWTRARVYLLALVCIRYGRHKAMREQGS